MEESSERLVRLEKYDTPKFQLIGLRDTATVDDSVAMRSIARYQRIMLELTARKQRPSSSFSRLHSSTFSMKKKKMILFSEEYVKSHGQLFLRFDGDEILPLEYLVDPHRCLDQFISAIDFCHNQGKNFLLDAYVKS